MMWNKGVHGYMKRSKKLNDMTVVYVQYLWEQRVHKMNTNLYLSSPFIT